LRRDADFAAPSLRGQAEHGRATATELMGTYCILVVENDLHLAANLERWLTSPPGAAFDVVVAHRPEDAAVWLTESRISAVVVDAEEYSGGRLDSLFPSDHATPGPPVVALVEAEESALAQSLLQRGVDDCLPLAQLNQALLVRVILHAIERHQVSEALRRSEHEFRQVIENAWDVIMVTESDGTHRYVSPAIERVLGYYPDELIDDSIFRHVHPDDVTTAQDAFRQSLERPGQPVWAALRARHRDGSTRSIEVTLKNLLEDEAVSGVVVNLRDVTERQRLADQLRQAQKLEAIGRLAAGVAHDFNNILTVINGFSELIQLNLRPDDPAQDFVKQIVLAGESAAVVTRQLLAFSRQQALDPREIDLNQVIRSSESLLRRLLGEDVELVISLDAALGHVVADPGQIEQVLVNLAAYAKDSMAGGGRLNVETSNVDVDETVVAELPELVVGPHVVLSLSDTGRGLDEEARTQIFEPFLRARDDNRDTGLGLAAVYGIVKQSNGSIQVTSEVDQGTTFTIFLPRVGQPTAPTGPGDLAPRSVGDAETILLVEDEARVRSLVRLVLESGGYRVLEADRGETGLEIALRHRGPIHLLVTDVVMPGINGRQLAEELLSTRPELRIIYMSGYTDDAALRLGPLHPQAQFIQKPFAPTALAQKVRQALDSIG
jgi:PAS domain S-box-containing protein